MSENSETPIVIQTSSSIGQGSTANYSPVNAVDPYPEFPEKQSPTQLTFHEKYPDYARAPSPDRGSYIHDEIIPPNHRHRTLILCFDGTGDQFDCDNSNVVQFFTMLKKDDPQEQLVYYQAGIGTYTIPEIAKPLMAKVQKTIDSMIGIHLDAHVMGGYEFIMQNYQAGDMICIFGFSRGGYIARSVAGMIHKVGLLPKCNHQQVPFAYKMYTRESELGWKQSTAFKKAFSIDVDIEFVGVWDTVGSVGVIPKRLPFTRSNTNIRAFRHAISLDERRARFHPNTWKRTTPCDHALGVQHGEMPKSRRKERRKSLHDLEREYSTSWGQPTDVEEVWFAGCHCDVGGGSVPNGTRNNLARIPLRWMVRQCFILQLGILFHKEMMKTIGIDPDALWPVVHQRPPMILPAVNENPTTTTTTPAPFVDEEQEDLRDALSPIYDQLKEVKAWWLLEILPTKLKVQKDDDSWAKSFSINLGRGRVVPRQIHGVKVHRTVKLRMEVEAVQNGKKYHPKAKLKVEPTWVD